MSIAMNIIEHAERFLGKFTCGWGDRDVENGINIITFSKRPTPNLKVFMSVGLSKHILTVTKQKTVRLELLFVTCVDANSAIVSSLMLSLCESILESHQAVLRGNVITLDKEFFKKTDIYGIYYTVPCIFDERFCTLHETTPPTVIAWAIPLQKKDVDFIEEYGWKPFEDLLEKDSFDLYSLKNKKLCSA